MLNQPTRSRSLTHVRARDCMHPGVLTCAVDTSLQDVAAIMTTHRVHAVVITSHDGGRLVGVVSDLDVVAGVAAGAELTAVRQLRPRP